MRKLILILIVIFTTSQVFAQSNWGAWKTSDCYKGLDYRTKKGDYNEIAKKYKWFVEFRNRYHEPLSLSTNLFATESEYITGKTVSRLTYIKNGESKTSWFLIKPTATNGIWIKYNKVRVGSNDSGDYYGCDM